MPASLFDIYELNVLGHKPGGRSYSNTIHYLIGSIDDGASVSSAQVAEAFYWAFNGPGFPGLGLGLFMSNFTVLDASQARRVTGFDLDGFRFKHFTYEDQDVFPWDTLIGPGLDVSPSSVAIRIDKITGDLSQNFKGRIHMGSVPEDWTDPSGDSIDSDILIDIATAADNLIVINGAGTGGAFQMNMVVLSGTHWVRYGGPIEEHYMLVEAFVPRPLVGTMVRRKAPYPT